MTRKAKIGWVVGGIALVVAAICVFSGGEKGEMGITCAGLASNDSRYVSFTISNSFNDEMYCNYELREFVGGNWQPCIDCSFHEIGFISTGGTTHFTLGVPSTNRWQVELNFTKAWPDNFISDARQNLIEFTVEHNLSVLEEVAKLGYTWQWSYGPEMLGNKPLAEAQK